MSGQGFLKDFNAFWSRPSLVEVNFPLQFLEFLEFNDFHDSGGGGPLFSTIFTKRIQLDLGPKSIFYSIG